MHCKAGYLLALTVIALGLAAMAGSCGRKGPLYLPDQTPARPPAPGADVPAPPPAPAGTRDPT